jgi:hypothetical protein
MENEQLAACASLISPAPTQFSVAMQRRIRSAQNGEIEGHLTYCSNFAGDRIVSPHFPQEKQRRKR